MQKSDEKMEKLKLVSNNFSTEVCEKSGKVFLIDFLAPFILFYLKFFQVGKQTNIA